MTQKNPVYGSILPGDIDVTRISSEGPKLLCGYIDFAIHGPSVFEREEKTEETKAIDSQFEEVVCRFLESRGYAIATHVGCSSYQVDIAVKHPTLSGQYLIDVIEAALSKYNEHVVETLDAKEEAE